MLVTTGVRHTLNTTSVRPTIHVSHETGLNQFQRSKEYTIWWSASDQYTYIWSHCDQYTYTRSHCNQYTYIWSHCDQYTYTRSHCNQYTYIWSHCDQYTYIRSHCDQCTYTRSHCNQYTYIRSHYDQYTYIKYGLTYINLTSIYWLKRAYNISYSPLESNNLFSSPYSKESSVKSKKKVQFGIYKKIYRTNSRTFFVKRCLNWNMVVTCDEFCHSGPNITVKIFLKIFKIILASIKIRLFLS